MPELFGGADAARASARLPLDEQRRRLCALLTQQADGWRLGEAGFVLLGLGQGGLLARALVQRGCPRGPEVGAPASGP